MTTFIDERFDGGGDGVALSTANTAFSAVYPKTGSVTFTTSSPIYGTADAVFSTTTSDSPLAETALFTGGAKPVVYVSVVGQYDALPPARLYVTQAMATGGQTRGGIRIETDGKVTIRNGFIAVDTSATTVPAGQPWRLDIKYDNTAGVCEARIFHSGNLHGSTPDEVISGTYDSGTIEYVNFGVVAAAAGVSYRLARAAVSDSGPFAPLGAPPSGPPTANVAQDNEVEVIDARGSTPGDGGTLTYSISQDSGDVATVTEPLDGLFLVGRVATATGWTVTVTESPSGQVDTATVAVAAAGAGGTSNVYLQTANDGIVPITLA